MKFPKLRNLIFLFCIFAVSLFAQGGGSNGFSKLQNVTTTSYTDSTCPNATTCYYQVTAQDSFGFESGPATCGPSQLCINGNTAVVQMPSSGTHTVTLNWTASTGATSYNVYRHLPPLGPIGFSATVN